MKKLNLFSKIFVKNLHKGKTPLDKMAEDVGALKGVFSFTGYDMKGKIISQHTSNNLIVNQSKSAIIKLLGQGQSIYSGVINPLDYKISKIRLSNDVGSGVRGLAGPNKLEYYNIGEASNRISYASNGIFGGGVYGQSICSTPTGLQDDDPDKHDFKKTLTNLQVDYKSAGANGKIFSIKSGTKPMSHGSMVVKLYRIVNGSEQVIEELYFNFKSGSVNTPAIYTRDPYANKPHKILNPKVNGSYYHVSTPMSANTDIAIIKGDVRQTLISTNNVTGTKLFYDYTAGENGWKLYLDEINPSDVVPAIKYPNTFLASGEGSGAWSKIEIEYTVGAFNVVNLIVPKSGFNNGFGSNESIRYEVGGASIDAYRTITPSYQDCADDFIDDYAVTFGAMIQYNEGNGINGVANSSLEYKKAFLFTENDEMFSSINFQTTEFQKNAGSAYQLSWKILAPIE